MAWSCLPASAKYQVCLRLDKLLVGCVKVASEGVRALGPRRTADNLVSCKLIKPDKIKSLVVQDTRERATSRWRNFEARYQIS